MIKEENTKELLEEKENIKELLEEKVIKYIIKGDALPIEEKKEFINYLKNEHKLDDDLAEDILGYKLFMDGIPNVIGEGTSQIVIKINDDLVAKIHKVKNINEYKLVDNHSAYGKVSYLALKELNFPVPETQFYDLNEGTLKIEDSKRDGTFFVVSKELTENGICRLYDFEFENLKKIKNGEEIVDQYITHKRMLQDMINNQHPKYRLGFTNHNKNKRNPEEAIRHGFFIQKNMKTKAGKLYLADFDHFNFYKK